MRASVILASTAVTSMVVTLWHPVAGGAILLLGVVGAALIVRANSRASTWDGPPELRRAGDDARGPGGSARRGVGVSRWMRGGGPGGR